MAVPDTIRVLVLREMPDAEQNLVWNLFSGDQERIDHAFQRLRPRVNRWSSILNDLLDYYGLEGMAMPYTMEDYERDARERFIRKLKPEEVLAILTPDLEQEVLQHLLVRLTPRQREDVEKYLREHKPSQEPDNLSAKPPGTH